MTASNSWPESWLCEATLWSTEHLGLNETEARTWAETVLAMNRAGIPVSVSDLTRFIDYSKPLAQDARVGPIMTEEQRRKRRRTQRRRRGARRPGRRR